VVFGPRGEESFLPGPVGHISVRSHSIVRSHVVPPFPCSWCSPAAVAWVAAGRHPGAVRPARSGDSHADVLDLEELVEALQAAGPA
jgi:hypothetical protein